MGGRNCCVKNCRRMSHDHRGRRIPNGLSFHCFPAWRRAEGRQISELTRRRRAAWVAAVGRGSITFSHIPTSTRVCSRHFHSGKPAYEMFESDPDWVPSLQLGHSEGRRRHSERRLLSEQPERDQRQRWTGPSRPAQRDPAGGLQRENAQSPPQRELPSPTETSAPELPEHGSFVVQPLRPAPARPAVRPWSAVKALLQSVLSKRPGDETHEHPPAVKKMDLSFRDFFRDALQASLEASCRSRTGSYKTALSFKPPPVKEQSQTGEESSSGCLNCVTLQRRITGLQEQLSRLPGEQEDAEASPACSQLQPDQVLQSPETVHIKEEKPAWMEPLSPPWVLLREGDQDVDTADESTNAAVSQDNPSSQRPKLRRPPRFKTAWLKMFWFLRYSQTFDQMWCHVCRLHADKSHQNLALIKGSRMFKIHNIKKHSNSKYHKDSVERHMLHMCDLQL